MCILFVHSLVYNLAKVGIQDLSPHLCNSAILRTTKYIAELRIKEKLWNCDCRLSKFDFCNSATLRSLLPVPLLSSRFSAAQGSFKNQLKIFLDCLFLCKPKTCLKGTVAQDFLASVFFMDLLYMGLKFRGYMDFLFFFIFMKLLEFFDESVL